MRVKCWKRKRLKKLWYKRSDHFLRILFYLTSVIWLRNTKFEGISEMHDVSFFMAYFWQYVMLIGWFKVFFEKIKPTKLKVEVFLHMFLILPSNVRFNLKIVKIIWTIFPSLLCQGIKLISFLLRTKTQRLCQKGTFFGFCARL